MSWQTSCLFILHLFHSPVAPHSLSMCECVCVRDVQPWFGFGAHSSVCNYNELFSFMQIASAPRMETEIIYFWISAMQFMWYTFFGWKLSFHELRRIRRDAVWKAHSDCGNWFTMRRKKGEKSILTHFIFVLCCDGDKWTSKRTDPTTSTHKKTTLKPKTQIVIVLKNFRYYYSWYRCPLYLHSASLAYLSVYLFLIVHAALPECAKSDQNCPLSFSKK